MSIFINLSYFNGKAMATHSSILAWKIPCTEEPGAWQATVHGSQRVGHDWATNTHTCKYFKLDENQIFLVFQFSRSVMSDFLQPHEPQHARSPCPFPTPRVYSNSCPLSRWCHPTISSSVVPLSSCLQSFPASGSFQMSQPFASGDQTTGVSASTSILPMNTQD